MTARRSIIALCVAVGLTACDKEAPASKVPSADELDVLEPPEPAAPAAPQTAEEKRAAAKEAAKNLPKVQDRDPEEEKRKMAQSRQRSAQARKMLEQKKFTEAVANARAALKIHEQNVDAMMVLGQVFYREGKYELVVSVTTSALAVDDKVRTPKDTSAVYNLQGFALASLGKDQMATQAFKKAAESDDQNAAAWNNLGTRYLRAGDVNTAESCFAYAIELEPSFAKAHLNHGAALRAQGKLEEAEKELRKAMELQRNYPEAHFNLGVLYLDAPQIREMSTKQRLEVAISELQRYKQLAGGRGSTEPRAKGLGSKKRIAAMSIERADDYIRLAQKGIEREDRAAKRKAERAAKAEEPDEETPQSPAVADADEDAPSAAADDPQAPAKPGAPQAPAKPGAPQAPAKPDDAPKAPAKPAEPSKPGTSPQAPVSPKQPAPEQPAPKQPAPKQPAPEQPAPKQPAPQQPAPQQPQKPSPQKPGQKSASAGNPLRCDDTNQVEGRRSVPRSQVPGAAAACRPGSTRGWT